MALRTVYPCYFDSSLTRKEGRRVSKSEAVTQPNLSRISRAAKAAGLSVAEEDAFCITSCPLVCKRRQTCC
ncbi:MAG TPA: signal recognition particle subunit SRP19/SEC65 family protein [Methanocorpusculum sp.]|nr:signal recognition particle subunit SRP19/SEC65 family protein [Methanocorpusculum sp.]